MGLHRNDAIKRLHSAIAVGVSQNRTGCTGGNERVLTDVVWKRNPALCPRRRPLSTLSINPIRPHRSPSR